jgi:hypothetical protein
LEALTKRKIAHRQSAEDCWGFFPEVNLFSTIRSRQVFLRT